MVTSSLHDDKFSKSEKDSTLQRHICTVVVQPALQLIKSKVVVVKSSSSSSHNSTGVVGPYPHAKPLVPKDGRCAMCTMACSPFKQQWIDPSRETRAS